MATPLTARFSVGRRSRNVYSASSAGGLLSSANPITPSKTGRHSVPASSSNGRSLNCHKRRYNQTPAYIYGFPTHTNSYFFQKKQNSHNNTWISSRLFKCALLLLAACFLGAFGLVKRINKSTTARGETSSISSQYSSTASGKQTDQKNDVLATTPAITAAPPHSSNALTAEQNESSQSDMHQLSKKTLPLYLDVTFFRVPCQDLRVSIFSTGKRDDVTPLSINTHHTVGERTHLNFKAVFAVNDPLRHTKDSKNHGDEQPVENAEDIGVKNIDQDKDVRLAGDISLNKRKRRNTLAEGYSPIIPKHDFEDAAAAMLEQVGQRFRRRLSRNLRQSQQSLRYHRRLEEENDETESETDQREETKEISGQHENQDQNVSDEAEITEENPDSEEAGDGHASKTSKNEELDATLDGDILDADDSKLEKTMQDNRYPNQHHQSPQNEGCQINGHVQLSVTNLSVASLSHNHLPPRPPTISIQASHTAESDSHIPNSISMDDMLHRVNLLKVGSPQTFPKEEAMVTVPFVSKTYDTRITNVSNTHHYYRIKDGFHLFPEPPPQNIEHQNDGEVKTQTTLKVPEIQFVFLPSSPSD